MSKLGVLKGGIVKKNVFPYPLVNTQKAIEMAIEIVDFPTKNGDFP